MFRTVIGARARTGAALALVAVLAGAWWPCASGFLAPASHSCCMPTASEAAMDTPPCCTIEAQQPAPSSPSTVPPRSSLDRVALAGLPSTVLPIAPARVEPVAPSTDPVPREPRYLLISVLLL
jgi:hypothetical protein